MEVHVPEKKRVRMIVDTDCKNEADDPFALVHHLLTPMFDVRGIIAAHFESKADVYGEGQTVHASMEEIQRVLALLGLPVACPVVLGADRAMTAEDAPVPSAGAQLRHAPRAACCHGLPLSAWAERPGNPRVSHAGRPHDFGGFLRQAGAAPQAAG